MRTGSLILLALAATAAARADFSYTMTRKSAQGDGETVKTSIKGQKMMIDSGRSVTIVDFDAQTVTQINHSQKSYTVKKFSDVALGSGGMTMTADVKDTGQKKSINGYNASETVMTVDADVGGRGTKMQIEMHIWISSDPPGAGELRAFYRKNAEHFPWSAMAASANPSMAKAMGELQRKLAQSNGVPVLEVIKSKMAGGSDQQAAASAQMEQMRARLEEMQKQGGPQAAAAAQALSRMSSMGGFETTMEAGNFSTAGIADSAFAVPAGYSQK